MAPIDPALMGTYDAAVIARHFRWRVGTLGWRILQISWWLGTFALGLRVDRWLNQEDKNRPRRAIQLRQVLTNLGPAFIKVGQALSTRPDLVRQDFLDELTKLQDQLPPFPTAEAMAIVEAELDYSPKEIFSTLSPLPVAAASLGQVYKGRLFSGEEVAVKVQRPHLRPMLCRDLYLMRWAAGWLGKFLPLNLGHDLTLIVDEFGTKLFEEIDYLNEGRNAERFAANFKDDPTVKVPVIYWPYCSHRVLTLEWIDGCKLTDMVALQQGDLDPDRLIEIGVTAGLRQLLEFGFFHADPHPGNLFALADGRMAYIDFGMMDQLDQITKEALVDAVVHLINQDFDSLGRDFVRLGFLTPETELGPIVPALKRVLGDAIGAKVSDFNFKTITDQFSELMYEYPFRVPAKFALIIRSLVTQEGLALSLNPEFKIVNVAYPYVARRLLLGETPALRQRLLEVLFQDGQLQWERLENMLAIAQGDTGFDLLPTAGLGLSYLMSEEGVKLRQMIVLALTEDDRLHTQEVQRLWALVKQDITFDKVLGVAWGAFTNYSLERAEELVPVVGDLRQALRT